jgi:hypothetical protein
MSSSTSRTIARVAVGAAMSLGALAAGHAPAGAASSGGIGRALESICAASGGTVVNNPFQLVRCQQVPPSRMRAPLLRVAEALCERGLGASFGAAPSFGSEGSITWVCS